MSQIFAIDTLSILRGELPPRALELVKEWGRLHQHELGEDWRRARQNQPLRSIDPLE